MYSSYFSLGASRLPAFFLAEFIIRSDTAISPLAAQATPSGGYFCRGTSSLSQTQDNVIAGSALGPQQLWRPANGSATMGVRAGDN
jgi:hypothetical protein